MICEDCLFEKGLEEYEFHHQSHRYKHYTCSICGELVSMNRGYNHKEYMDNLIEKYIERKKNETNNM
jgi:hypothetical protein